MEITYHHTDIDRVAQEVLTHWHTPILLFEAPMGAGKTTFIKALCQTLGVKEAISSPTFSLVNCYMDSKNNPIYHFDLYRLNSLEEALDIGIEDYLDSGHRCLIEWPDKIRQLLPKTIQTIRINADDTSTRTLQLEG